MNSSEVTGMNSILDSLKQHFHTEWAAMTLPDWIGVIMTVLVFLIMIGLYVFVFLPSNKDKLEAQRYIPLEEDQYPDHENRL
jgi:cytochrome c oxidase cbb3-type subunit 4